MVHLEELCQGKGEQLSSTAGSSRGRDARQKRKRRKLTVLEASAARIERLERLLNADELANGMAEAQVAAMSAEITGIIQRERPGMQWLDSSRALHGSSLLDLRFGYTLLDVATGRLLDATPASSMTPATLLSADGYINDSM